MGSFADLEAGDGVIATSRKTGNEIKNTGKLSVVLEPEEAGLEVLEEERDRVLVGTRD